MRKSKKYALISFFLVVSLLLILVSTFSTKAQETIIGDSVVSDAISEEGDSQESQTSSILQEESLSSSLPNSTTESIAESTGIQSDSQIVSSESPTETFAEVEEKIASTDSLLSGKFGGVTWEFDDSKKTVTFSVQLGDSGILGDPLAAPWRITGSGINSVKKIIFADVIKGNPNSEGLFANLINLKEFEGMNNFVTSDVTDMSKMFAATGLETLDLSNFDTSNVTNMRSMFSNSSSLKELNLDNFDTSNVTDMSQMFLYFAGAENLNLSSFDTSNVTNMDQMFSLCLNLKTLNIDSFVTSSVTTMIEMFMYCKLETLDVSHFNTSKVTDMSYMFCNLSKLKTLDLSNFYTSNVTNMNAMFEYSKNLESLNLSNFDTSNVADTVSMFYGCEKLKSLSLSSNFKFGPHTDLTDNPALFEPKWVGQNTGTIFGNSALFMSDYNGQNPDTYERSYLKFAVTYDTSAYDADGNIIGAVDSDGGNSPLYTMFTGIPELKPALKTGYTFTGWYDSPYSGGTKVDGISTTQTGDITLYPKFTINDYIVSFDDQGTINTQSVTYDSLVTMPTTAPTKIGHTFVEWELEDGTTWDFTTQKMPAYNITLVPKFSVNYYTISFDDRGTISTQSIAYDTLVAKPTTKPTEVGHTFTGWALEDGTVWDFTTQKMLAKDITLVPKFSINNYTVSFNNQGQITTQSVTYDSLVVRPTDPTKVGSIFVQWELEDGTVWDFTTQKMPAGDITLVPTFKLADYTLQYVSYDLKELSTYTLHYEDSVPLQEAPRVGGHHFAGWVIEGTDTKWDPSNSMPPNDLVLVATYDKNVSTTTSSTSKSPKTGDNTQLVPAVATFSIASLSLVSLAFIIIRKRKTN